MSLPEPPVKLKWSWYRTSTHVYYANRRIRGADAESFEPLSPIWARDTRRIFALDAPLRQADHKTFTVLNSLYAKDKNSVWSLEGAIREADAATFEAIGSGHETGRTQGYAKDKNHVFHYVETIGKPVIVRGANPAAFRLALNGFGIDDQKVYCERSALPRVDPEFWQPLQGAYSRDRRRVYFWNSVVKGADADSFEALPVRLPSWGRDKTNYYHDDKVCRDWEYVEDISGSFILVGYVVRAFVIDRHGKEIPHQHQPDCNNREGVRLEIECKQWIRRPVDASQMQADHADRVAFHEYMDFRRIDDWRGKEWIFFLHSHDDGLTPNVFWRDFEPTSSSAKVQSIVELIDAHEANRMPTARQLRIDELKRRMAGRK